MGLGALYAEMVQPSRPLRATFLAKLLQPFDSACNLNSPAAAAAGLRRVIASTEALAFDTGNNACSCQSGRGQAGCGASTTPANRLVMPSRCCSLVLGTTELQSKGGQVACEEVTVLNVQAARALCAPCRRAALSQS